MEEPENMEFLDKLTSLGLLMARRIGRGRIRESRVTRSRTEVNQNLLNEERS